MADLGCSLDASHVLSGVWSESEKTMALSHGHQILQYWVTPQMPQTNWASMYGKLNQVWPRMFLEWRPGF